MIHDEDNKKIGDSQQRMRTSLKIPACASSFVHFEDLDLNYFGHRSICIALLLSLIELMQTATLTKPLFNEERDHSFFHRYAYKEILPMMTLIDFKSITLKITCFYLSSKLIIGVWLVSLASNSFLERIKNQRSLQATSFLILIDVHVLFVPTLLCTAAAIIEKNHFLGIYGFVSILILWIEILVMNISCYDFGFTVKRRLQKRSFHTDIFKYVALTAMGIFSTLLPEGVSWKVVTNLVCIAAPTMIIIEDYKNLHLFQCQVIQYSFWVFWSILIFQATSFSCAWIEPSLMDYLDMDVALFLSQIVILKFLGVIYSNKVHKLCLQDVYRVINPQEGELVLTLLDELYSSKTNSVELLGNLFAHNQKCSKITCLCFLLKHYYMEKEIKNCGPLSNLRQMRSLFPKIKLSLFNNESSIESLRKDYMQKLGDYHNNHTIDQIDSFINIRSSYWDIVFGSFFSNMMNSIKGDIARPMIRFVSFLDERLESYVGSILYLYNYVYSHRYKDHQTISKDIILLNAIELSERKIHNQFLESKYWLSEETFLKVHEINSRLDLLKQDFSSLSKFINEYYEELAHEEIVTHYLSKSAEKVLFFRNRMENELNNLIEEKVKSQRLEQYYIFYEKNFFLTPDYYLMEHYSKLNYLRSMRDKGGNLTEVLHSRSTFNMFDDSLIAIFISVSDEKHIIRKSTSNAPGFFGYSTADFHSLPIKELMPEHIKRCHDSFIFDFLNQRYSDLSKTAMLRSFALTASKELKVLSVFAKLEYFMSDNVYLGGLVINEPINNSNVLLSDAQGKVQGINSYAKELFGNDIIQNPYFLFVVIPLLIKYYYPDAKNQLKYKSVYKASTLDLKRNGVSNLNIRDKSDNTEETSKLGINFSYSRESFGAFFFRFAKRSRGFKGLDAMTSQIEGKLYKRKIAQNERYAERNESAILGDFSYEQLSTWKLIRTNSSSLKMPKYFQIVTKILAKNRNLILDNLTQIYKVKIDMHTYRYRGHIAYKLLSISGLKQAKQEAVRFFQVAAESLKRELFDMFLVEPRHLSKLYHLMKIEKVLTVKIVIQESVYENQTHDELHSDERSNEEDVKINLIPPQGEIEDEQQREESCEISDDEGEWNLSSQGGKDMPMIAEETKKYHFFSSNYLDYTKKTQTENTSPAHPSPYLKLQTNISNYSEVNRNDINDQSPFNMDLLLSRYSTNIHRAGTRFATISIRQIVPNNLSLMSPAPSTPSPFLRLYSKGNSRRSSGHSASNLLQIANLSNLKNRLLKDQQLKELVDVINRNDVLKQLDREEEPQEVERKWRHQIQHKLHQAEDTPLHKQDEEEEEEEEEEVEREIQEEIEGRRSAGQKVRKMESKVPTQKDNSPKLGLENSQQKISIRQSKDIIDQDQKLLKKQVDGGGGSVQQSVISQYNSANTKRLRAALAKETLARLKGHSEILLGLLLMVLGMVFWVCLGIGLTFVNEAEDVVLRVSSLNKSEIALGFIFKEFAKLSLYSDGLIKNSELIEIINIHHLRSEREIYLQSYANSSYGISCDKDKSNCVIPSSPLRGAGVLTQYNLLCYLLDEFIEKLNSEIVSTAPNIEGLLREFEEARTMMFKLYKQINDVKISMTTLENILVQRFQNIVLLLVVILIPMTFAVGMFLAVSMCASIEKTKELEEMLSRISKLEINFFRDRYITLGNDLASYLAWDVFFELVEFPEGTKEYIMIHAAKKAKKSIPNKVTKKGITTKKNTESRQKNKRKMNTYIGILGSSLTFIIILYNLISYIIIQYNVSEMKQFNDIVIIGGRITNNLMMYYGIFYSLVHSIFNNVALDPLEARLGDTLADYMKNREALHQALIPYTSILSLMNEQICLGLNLSKVDLEECNLLGDKNIIKPLIRINDLNNHYQETIAILKSDRQANVFTGDQFIIDDISLYYLQMKLNLVLDKIKVRVLDNFDSIRLIIYIIGGVFFIIIIFVQAIFRCIWRRMMISSIQNLIDCFLVLPSFIILNNSWLINFFRLKQLGFVTK